MPMASLRKYRTNLKAISNYNNVENFSKEQLGYLGGPLIVSDSILDAIHVHHMNTNNVNYTKSAPKIPNGAPLADFIYEDIMLRCEELVQRYLCGEDEILATQSQMTRMVLKHFKKYHSLLKSTTKEAKLALNKERKRKIAFTNATSNLALSNVSERIRLQKEIERKTRDLKQSKNTAKQRNIEAVLAQLRRRRKEVNASLKRVPPGKKTRAQEIVERELKQEKNQADFSGLLKKRYVRLDNSTKMLITPKFNLKTPPANNKNTNTNQTCENYKTKDKNTAHLVFSSHPVSPSQVNNNKKYFLLECEDTRVSSTSLADFDEWNLDGTATQVTPFKGVVESLSRRRIPFRTVFGDRLVKRRLVLHSFVERLNAALYLNYTRNNTRSESHPLYKRFSGLFLANTNMNKNIKNNKNNKNNIGNVNTTTDDLLWNEQLRSFGRSGPQDYWIQLLREMYDSRRVENIRSKLRILNSKQKKNNALTSDEVFKKFQNLNLGDNLGVTCYGYTCNPRDRSAPWSPSYHRLGRSWFCTDINKDEYQLPFGCYSDRCAPPFLPISHPNYNSSNSGTAPSRIRGDLELITVNNICTTILQKESKFGTQGRFGHVKTAYKGQRIGKMSPVEVLKAFTMIREAYDDRNQAYKTASFEIKLGDANTNYGMQIRQGPELEHSVLLARNTLGVNVFNNNLNNKSKVQTVVYNEINAGPKSYNNYENLSSNISRKNARKNDELEYNTNKLKNDTKKDRLVKLREYLLRGSANDWNTNTLGPKKVTGHNLDLSKFKNMGAGLKLSSKDVKRDTETLDENFMMIDGDIFTGCSRTESYLLYGGSERALGITKKFITNSNQAVMPVVPLIVPVNPNHGSYPQVKKRSATLFDSLLDDSTGGVQGLVNRQMQNVCMPLFKSGSMLKGTHFNDLMGRFLEAVGDLEIQGVNLEVKLQSPKLYNIMKCIQFYLYLHVGMSTQEALTEIAKYQARRNAKDIQRDMYTLSTKLRLLGNTGPMPKKMFQKIVRQYLLVSKNNNYMQPESVQSEINELENKLSSFKIFGKKFARQSFLPSFMGGVQKANKKMGIPSVGFNKKLQGTGTSFNNVRSSVKRPIRTIRKLVKPSVNQKEKRIIGSGGNNRFIKNTEFKMTGRNKSVQDIRKTAKRTVADTKQRIKRSVINPDDPLI